MHDTAVTYDNFLVSDLITRRRQLWNSYNSVTSL